MKALGQIIQLVHAPLRPFPPSKVFEAPVIEIVFRTLKDQASKPELQAALGVLRGLLANAEGLVGAAIAQTVENENVSVGFLGWESVEVSS